MYKHNRPCPLCLSDKRKVLFCFNIADFDDSLFPTEIQSVSCETCGFVYNDNNLLEDYDKYYENESLYLSDSSFGTGGLTSFDLNRYQVYVEILKRYIDVDDAFIVDIGCGKGGLLSFLERNGFNNTAGVELDSRLVEKAVSLGLNVKKGTASNIPVFSEYPQVICLSHLLEHLYDLQSVIQSLSNNLKEGGYVFIEVPDASNYSTARVYDGFWLLMREHINHFDLHHLESLMGLHGFEIVYSSETLMPYNSNLRYPSLIALFRKTSNRNHIISRSDQLEVAFAKYVEDEMHEIKKTAKKVNEIREKGKNISVWGVGAEFFSTYSFTSLKDMDIQFLIDMNPNKQNHRLNGIPISSQDIENKLQNSQIILVFSVFRHHEIEKAILGMGFTGEIIIFGDTADE